jgi:hypothetical protein
MQMFSFNPFQATQLQMRASLLHIYLDTGFQKESFPGISRQLKLNIATIRQEKLNVAMGMY